jgi:hypothetical protein
MSNIIHDTATLRSDRHRHPAWCDRSRCEVTGSQLGDVVAHRVAVFRTRTAMVDTGDGTQDRWAETLLMQWSDEQSPFVMHVEHLGDQVTVTSYRDIAHLAAAQLQKLDECIHLHAAERQFGSLLR